VNALGALAAALPCVLLAWHVGRRLHGRAAARAVWTTFLFGALSTLFVFAVAARGALTFSAPLPLYMRALVDAFGRAALPEEAAKLVAVVGFAVARGHVWDRRTGVAHGLAASAGFAAVEMVLATLVSGPGAALLRIVTALPCHFMAGIAMGAFVGDAVWDASVRYRRMTMAFCVPVLLHGAYDYPLMVLAQAARARVDLGVTELAALAAAGALVLVGGVVGARRVYQSVFPQSRGGSLRDRAVGLADRLLRSRSVAWALVPVGGLLASAGGWLVGSLLFFPVRMPSPPANAAAAVSALYAVGAALICFGLAFAFRGLRARRRVLRLAAAAAR